MEKILSIKNGKTLFLKYGYTNLNVYCNCTETERAAILEAVETKGRLTNWSKIKQELFPPVKKKINTGTIQEAHNKTQKELVVAKEEIKELKTKKIPYDKMKEQLAAAKKEIKTLKMENELLKATLEQYRNSASLFLAQVPDFKNIGNRLNV